MPPNCVLEVDDVLQDWTWKNKFDLIHMRIMDAAFNDDEREKLYSECYKYVILRAGKTQYADFVGISALAAGSSSWSCHLCSRVTTAAFQKMPFSGDGRRLPSPPQPNQADH